MANQKSARSVYTCRSSRLFALVALNWLLAFIALGTLIGVVSGPTPALSPDGRALVLVLLGILLAGGIVFGCRYVATYAWTRFELDPETLRYFGAPTTDGPAELSTPWEKLEIRQDAEGKPVLVIGGEIVPVSPDLVGYDRFLEEIEERGRDRIPFPQVGWPDIVQHPRLTDGLLADVQRGILAGQTIQMVKVVQDATGIRSRECLVLVEQLRKNLEQAAAATY